MFGGTFDPIHNAHLEVARTAAASFALRKILFVPSGTPPHKRGAQASFEDRVRMVERAIAGEPLFEVSTVEQGAGKSYSVLTIERLLAEGYSGLGFLIGADAFAEITTWYRWRDLASMVEFLVVTRPGSGYAVPEGVRVRALPGMHLDVSSSAVRASVAEDLPDIPVPPAVLDWIRERGLYRSQPGKISLSPYSV